MYSCIRAIKISTLVALGRSIIEGEHTPHALTLVGWLVMASVNCFQQCIDINQLHKIQHFVI